MPREFVVLDHTSNVQCLETNRVEPFDQITAHLVQEIIPTIAHTLVGPRESNSGFFAVLTALLGSRESFVQYFQPRKRIAQVTWILDLFTRGQGCKVLDAYVHTDRSFNDFRFWCCVLVFDIHQYRNMELPCLVATDRTGSDLAFKASREFCFDLAEFRDGDAVGLEIDTHTLRVVRAVVLVLTVELGESFFLFEELGERPLEMNNGLLQRLRCNFGQPFLFCFQYGSLLVELEAGFTFAYPSVLFDFSGESPVIDIPHAPKLLCEHFSLPRCGDESVPICL